MRGLASPHPILAATHAVLGRRCLCLARSWLLVGQRIHVHTSDPRSPLLAIWTLFYEPLLDARCSVSVSPEECSFYGSTVDTVLASVCGGFEGDLGF